METNTGTVNDNVYNVILLFGKKKKKKVINKRGKCVKRLRINTQ